MDRRSVQHFVVILISLVIGFGLSKVPHELFSETGSVIAVVLIFIPALLSMVLGYQYRGFIAVLVLGLFALGIESIGIATGFPYSFFEYTSDFGYLLLGTTPWTVAIAWSPLVIGSYLIAQRYRGVKSLILYLCLLVGTDLALDPGAVARGLWEYQLTGVWYGIPVYNFLGWVFSGSIAYLILKVLLVKKLSRESLVYLGSLSLVISIGLWTGASVGYGLLGPVVVGILLTTLTSYYLVVRS